MDCIVHGVAKSQTRLSDFHFHLYVFTNKQKREKRYHKTTKDITVKKQHEILCCEDFSDTQKQKDECDAVS